MNFSKIKFFFALILVISLPSMKVAGARTFSIDQEFQVRKLSKSFSKKYGMKIVVKREKGKLLVKFWDKGFFNNDWRLTPSGASFIRTVSKRLCVDESKCEVLLKSHHVESASKNSSKRALVKSQFKLLSVSKQVLNSKISPSSLIQMSLGDREPFVDPEKNDSSEKFSLREMNTRVEIAFGLKNGDE